MLLCTITRSARSLRPCVRPDSNPILFLRGASRALSTLPENPSIYVFPHPSSPQNSLLTLLPTDPPNPHLSIGTCTSLPPTPQNFTPNPHFLPLLSSVFASHATSDPAVRQQAAVFASPGGFNLGGPSSSNDGAGAGGASRGGWLHVSDERNPPDWGRIAWPEDIFGSVEVDGEGEFVGGDGRWQDSGTYRVVTREGILGLTPFMRGKVVERLREVERQTEKK